MDGMLYSSVAHNLSKGLGTFWNPTFNTFVHLNFHEQPPLTFGIQAMFFKLLGDAFYVESIYGFVFCAIHIYLIHLIWKEIFIASELKKLSWLPILFWISIPIVSWDFVNNMEEITMGAFVQLAILFIIKSINFQKFVSPYPILAGVSISLAWLCKGFPGLFPLAAFFWAFVFFKPYSLAKAAINYLGLIGAVLLFFAALYWYPVSHDNLSIYLTQRVLNSIKNVAETDNRFYIIGRLLGEILIPIALVVSIFIIQKIKKQVILFEKNWVLFFIILGFCGVLPLMVTLEQRGFYMVTALPCFAIGLSIIIAPTLLNWVNVYEYKLIKWLKPITVVGSIAVTIIVFVSFGKFKRDEPSLSDINSFGKIIPSASKIGVSADLREDWGTGCYFQRYFLIEVDGGTDQWNKHQFVVLNKSSENNYLPQLQDYKKVNLTTQQFNLYQHK
jgi:hypothetical protein